MKTLSFLAPVSPIVEECVGAGCSSSINLAVMSLNFVAAELLKALSEVSVLQSRRPAFRYEKRSLGALGNSKRQQRKMTK